MNPGIALPVVALRAAIRLRANPPIEVNAPPANTREPSFASARTVSLAPAANAVSRVPESRSNAASRLRVRTWPVLLLRSWVKEPPTTTVDPIDVIA